jgi:hypothetical protein
MIAEPNFNFQRFIARGMISRNQQPYCSQAIGFWVCDEYQRQREQVARRRFCEGQCAQNNLVENNRGEIVCRWTKEPCKTRGLEAIVKLYSIINRGRYDNRSN